MSLYDKVTADLDLEDPQYHFIALTADESSLQKPAPITAATWLETTNTSVPDAYQVLRDRVKAIFITRWFHN